MQDPNICLMTDGYKLGHHKQYLPGTERVLAYWESRKGAQWDHTVFFGLQYLVKRYLAGPVVTSEKIEHAAKVTESYMGDKTAFNRTMWEYILKEYEGRLPVRIMAPPEGSLINVSNVMMTVENTDKAEICAPLTNHLETILSQLWYPCTVATLSREVKKLILKYAKKSVDDAKIADMLMWMLHDFGFRGATCYEAAAWGGAAHLLNFMGTDTLPALAMLEEYYGSTKAANSVYATEHSVMTAGGPEGEDYVVDHLLNTHPTGPLSIVIDSYNYREFLRRMGGERFKMRILNRDGVTIFRPDSGIPVNVMAECLRILANGFGAGTNSKGYLELNPKVKTLWGDGLNLGAIEILLDAIVCNMKWSLSNIATLGMGGGLLQQVNRDTQRFAFKCSAQKRCGVWRDIKKNPLDSSKASKAGRLALVKLGINSYGTRTIPYDGNDPDEQRFPNVLRTVFEDGYHNALTDTDIHEMRMRASF